MYFCEFVRDTRFHMKHCCIYDKSFFVKVPHSHQAISLLKQVKFYEWIRLHVKKIKIA